MGSRGRPRGLAHDARGERHRHPARAGFGFSLEDVATRIVDVLAVPPHVVHVEVALPSIDEG